MIQKKKVKKVTQGLHFCGWLSFLDFCPHKNIIFQGLGIPSITLVFQCKLTGSLSGSVNSSWQTMTEHTSSICSAHKIQDMKIIIKSVFVRYFLDSLPTVQIQLPVLTYINYTTETMPSVMIEFADAPRVSSSIFLM